MLLTLLFIDFQEILIILVAVVLLFGTKSLPEIARGLGHAMRHFRMAADDIKREIINPTGFDVSNHPINKINKEVKEGFDKIENNIIGEVKDIQKSIGSIEGTMKRDG